MFHLFTEKAIKTIMLAQKESISSGHYCVAPEQILLGVMGAGDSMSLTALKNMGVSLEMIRSEVGKIVPNGSLNPAVIEIPFCRQCAKRALEAILGRSPKVGPRLHWHGASVARTDPSKGQCGRKGVGKCRCGHYDTSTTRACANEGNGTPVVG